MPLIALIDDDSDFTTLVSELLEEQGWRVVICREENDAVRCVEDEKPDVVILDIRMQTRRSGWEILAHLQEEPATRSIPVIVSSAAIDDLQAREEWMAERDVMSLPKPFNIDDLLTLVGRALDTSKGCRSR